jgi:hypothetical protein
MFVNYHVTIKAPLKGNPCIEIWCNLANYQLLSQKLYEWLKLIELSTTIAMGSVEDGSCLSNLGFMKNTFTNMLTTHSDLAFKMFVKKFIISKQVSFCYNNECSQCCKVLTWSRGIVGTSTKL